MASGKKLRKIVKAKRERLTPPGQARRIADGDRRRRGGMRVQDALAFKKAKREGLIPPDVQLD
jgi:hypothetical protein